ncbi:acyl-ACP--UDP-N-acetylglucosamine O-acyltransferase [Desulfoferrobacter suflitae]|uniref:acyl-ACP--UDP-N-acetylglucosamine O-acyltransferase n=1 Tax=Desulfoferrobacter suflitae TaxID=2865782 RepID=UPI0021640B38|nr:acyl-ACP--UDP-N-acetylglucosamine O-acyltransferase [Desulfoferrobacter suflitae]MCK8600570.1 acyl-ACP--UDP-N-acetylglucosamine O-acyltransferase [Desulfoferrobacter suflitae]
MEIHPTAIVASDAQLAEDVIIRPYSIIGPHVKIGSGTVVGPHAIIDGRTTIGERNQIYPFTTLGYPPQDLSYKDEETELIIGDENIIRENATIHRGTVRGGGVTILGERNFVMAYAHVAHDCKIGNYVILANAATLAGHVRIDDHAVIGGLVAIHQFIRIGTHAFIGGKSGLRMDMPPYMLAFGAPAKLYGPNLVGLKRKGFSNEAIQALKKCYRILFRSGLTLDEAIIKARQEVEPLAEVVNLLHFVADRSRRGITR